MVRGKPCTIPKKPCRFCWLKIWQLTKMPQKYPYKKNILLYLKILHASQIAKELIHTTKALLPILKADTVIVFTFICRMQVEEIIQVIRTTFNSFNMMLKIVYFYTCLTGNCKTFAVKSIANFNFWSRKIKPLQKVLSILKLLTKLTKYRRPTNLASSIFQASNTWHS